MRYITSPKSEIWVVLSSVLSSERKFFWTLANLLFAWPKLAHTNITWIFQILWAFFVRMNVSPLCSTNVRECKCNAKYEWIRELHKFQLPLLWWHKTEENTNGSKRSYQCLQGSSKYYHEKNFCSNESLAVASVNL